MTYIISMYNELAIIGLIWSREVIYEELPMPVASIFIAELSLCIDFSFSAPDMAVGCYG